VLTLFRRAIQSSHERLTLVRGTCRPCLAPRGHATNGGLERKQHSLRDECQTPSSSGSPLCHIPPVFIITYGCVACIYAYATSSRCAAWRSSATSLGVLLPAPCSLVHHHRYDISPLSCVTFLTAQAPLLANTFSSSNAPSACIAPL